MRKPLRDFGSHPLDHVRRTLSLQLRAILYDEGLVDSPNLPLRPLPPCYCVRLPEDQDGLDSEARASETSE